MKETLGNPQRAGVGYIIGNFMIRGIGFITLPIFSRLLTTEDFGIFNTFISYEGILFIVIGLALHTSFKNANLKYEDRFRDYLSDCIAICIITSAVLLLLILLWGVFAEPFDLNYAVILVLSSTSTAIISYYNSYIGLFYQSRKYVLISGINAILNILISLILILTLFKDERAMGRIYGRVLPIVFIASVLVIRAWKISKPKLNSNYIRYALFYSIPLVPHGLSQVILSSSDRIMISKIVGNSEAGIYSFSYTLAAIVLITYSSLEQVWSPWFYKSYSSSRFDDIKRNANTYLTLMSLLTVMIVLVAPEVTLIIGTEKFCEAIQLTVPVIIGTYFVFLYSFPSVIEYYYEKTKYIAIGTIFAAIINVGLNIIFIPQYGYSAAAYTTLVTYFLYFIFHWYISYKILNNHTIYDVRYFVVIIMLVLISSLLVQCNLSKNLTRWIIACIIGCYTVIYANKRIGLKNIFLFRITN